MYALIANLSNVSFAKMSDKTGAFLNSFSAFKEGFLDITSVYRPLVEAT